MLASFAKVNLWSVLLAGISYLILGMLWYSPLLFGKQWMELNGFTDKDLKTNKPMWVITLLSFLSAAIASFVISMVLGPNSNAPFGAIIGACIAVFWISMSKLTDVLFENKPVKLFLLHAGFDIVAFMIMGAIVAYWR
jgi:L-lactate permease